LLDSGFPLQKTHHSFMGKAVSKVTHWRRRDRNVVPESAAPEGAPPERIISQKSCLKRSPTFLTSPASPEESPATLEVSESPRIPVPERIQSFQSTFTYEDLTVEDADAMLFSENLDGRDSVASFSVGTASATTTAAVWQNASPDLATTASVTDDLPPAPRIAFTDDRGVSAAYCSESFVTVDSQGILEIDEDEVESLIGITGGKLRPMSGMRLRPMSGVSVTSLHSGLSWSSNCSTKRLKDWNRCSDRNLCHLYRLCEEFLLLGHAQSRPDHFTRGVDFAVARKQVHSDAKGAGKGASGGRRQSF